MVSFATFPSFSGWPVHKQLHIKSMAVTQAKLTPSETLLAYAEIGANNGTDVPIAQQPTAFPTFSDWEAHKRYHVSQMSVAQADTHCVYVVATDDIEQNFNRCRLCSERFKLVFHQEEEEWVYQSCKVLDGQPYHFPLCWEYAHEC